MPRRISVVLLAVLLASCGGSTVSDQQGVRALMDSAAQSQAAGKFQECIAEYTKVVNLYSDVVGAYSGRAACYMQADNAPGAVHDYTQAIRLSPSDPELYLLRASAEEQVGNRSTAAADYKRVTDLNSTNPSQVAEGAEGLMAIGYYQDALSVLDHGTKRYPDSWLLHKDRADVEMLLANDNETVREFQVAVQLASGNNLANVLGDRGNFFLLRHQYKLALADYNRAVELNPADYNYFDGRAKVLLGMAQLVGAETDLSSAIKVFKVYGPSDIRLLVGLLMERGRLYLDEGKKDKAAADFKEALRVNPPFETDVQATIQRLLLLATQ